MLTVHNLHPLCLNKVIFAADYVISNPLLLMVWLNKTSIPRKSFINNIQLLKQIEINSSFKPTNQQNVKNINQGILSKVEAQTTNKNTAGFFSLSK
jgi:hypothetical protein